MEIIDQYSIHYDFPPKIIRPAARGLVISDGKILLTYEKNTDVYMSPGGRKEDGESFEECCIREISEESGYNVKIIRPFFGINESLPITLRGVSSNSSSSAALTSFLG